MNRKDHDAHCFLLGDFNCKIGSLETPYIGGANWDFEDIGGEQLRTLCMEHQLMIPSTFEQFHSDKGATFVSRLGRTSRLDYIAIDEECGSSVTRSYVHDEIDLMNGDFDHKLLCLELQIKCGKQREGSLQRKPLYAREEVRKDKR